MVLLSKIHPNKFKNEEITKEQLNSCEKLLNSFL